MNTNTQNPGLCRRYNPGPTAETLRHQGYCFLGFGIALCVTGVALIVVSIVIARSYVIGPTVVVFVWGVILLFFSYRRFQIAKWIETNPSTNNALPPNFMTQTNHPTTFVNQQPGGSAQIGQPPTAFSSAPPYPTGYTYQQQSGFGTVFTGSTTQFSSTNAPYPTQAMSPPAYEDVAGKKN